MHVLVHFARFLAGLDYPHSQVTNSELLLLQELARNSKVIVELGCYEGKTSCAMAMRSPGFVYSIDPFFSGRMGLCYSEYIARLHARRSKLSNVKFIKAFSYDAAPGFTQAVDLLFIDADHSYEAIQRDWKDWEPRVRPGGFIALHDAKPGSAGSSYLGSMKFYAEDIPQLRHVVREILAVESLVVLQKVASDGTKQ
jgi:predicted O-methyltransferase YrrM